jgi:predicted ATPase/DNA-binding winged helix-turn-helix (wHTH) protein
MSSVDLTLEHSSTASKKISTFGPFTLLPSERLLKHGQESVAIGSRALDLLIVLVERAGEVVSKRELLTRVWPGVVVTDGSLRFHITGLRKALGDAKQGVRYIENVSGRGYSFVAPLTTHGQLPSALDLRPNQTVERLPTTVPPALGRIVGREEVVHTLASLLRSRRFVSIVGAGGVGKTTVALSVAHVLAADFQQQAYFVDLASVADPSFVVHTVVAALAAQIQDPDMEAGLMNWLRERKTLIVLDNCEHVIDASAALAQRMYVAAPSAYILTTSREALRSEDEQVHLLLPLRLPPLGEVTAQQALACPAVQLFMERAFASGYRGDLTDQDAPLVVEICRRLDGIALAIELAASHVGAHGLAGTVKLLNSRFGMLWRGRRCSLPRHQTLQAMLDWSYKLLTESERCVLDRLSVFLGPFTLDAACAVVSDPGLVSMEVEVALANLIDTSLVSVSVNCGIIQYHLADTTRSYASGKLLQSGEANAVARRHAEYYSDSPTMHPSLENMSAMRPHLGNIRAALDWSFGLSGDIGIGIRLAKRAVPFFLTLSMLIECQRWSRTALAALPSDVGHTACELMLCEALASSMIFTLGQGGDAEAVLDRGLAIAERLDEPSRQLSLLVGLHTYRTRLGQFARALSAAQRGMIVAKQIDDPAALAIAEWMRGCAFHHMGDQAAAQVHCEAGFIQATLSERPSFNAFGHDQRTRAMLTLARVLWLRGCPDRSERVARDAIMLAEQSDNPVNLCISLMTSAPTVWRGDLDTATKRADRLIGLATANQLGPYLCCGLEIQGEIAIARGDGPLALRLLDRCLELSRIERYHRDTAACYRAIAQAHMLCGDVEAAIRSVDTAFRWVANTGHVRELPDIFRVNAATLLAVPSARYAEAEAALTQSLKEAARQGALALELKAAIELARLLKLQGRPDDARYLLDPIYQRFDEGFATADLVAARALLEEH